MNFSILAVAAIATLGLTFGLGQSDTASAVEPAATVAAPALR